MCSGFVLREASTGGVLLKEGVLKNSQISQKTNVLEPLFKRLENL